MKEKQKQYKENLTRYLLQQKVRAPQRPLIVHILPEVRRFCNLKRK